MMDFLDGTFITTCTDGVELVFALTADVDRRFCCRSEQYSMMSASVHRNPSDGHAL
jgi:hypothetical protein